MSLLQENLFQIPGLQTELQQIRDCLDTGVPDVLRILSLFSSISSIFSQTEKFTDCRMSETFYSVIYDN